MKPVLRAFKHDGACLVGDQPVQLRGGKLSGKRRSDEIAACKRPARLLQIPARAEKPLDQLKLRHVRLSVCRLCVCGVADEVEPRDAEPRLVDRVVEQRKSVFHMRHADHGVVRLQRRKMAQRNREAARYDADLLAVGKLVVEIAPEIKVLCLICCGCTHVQNASLSGFCFLAYHKHAPAIQCEIVNYFADAPGEAHRRARRWFRSTKKTGARWFPVSRRPVLLADLTQGERKWS